MRHHLARILSRVALALTVLLGGYLAGVAATVLAPTSIETPYYRADVTLTADPRIHSRIDAQTTVGSVGAAFAGLAPGIRVEPRIKPSITQVLDGPITIRGLQPTSAQVSAAVRQAALGVGLRFAVGAVVGVGAVLALARRRPTSPATPRAKGAARLLAAATAGWVAVVGGGALAVQSTYRAERLTAFDATGLIGLATENRSLLEDVETRANQATPYLKNLLALSDALKQQYAPAEVDAGGAVRILLVSDIHAANQYALMRTIVREQGIDAVIDTGDLINLGVPQEAVLSRLYSGIASLDVPYLFVSGNHDANAPGSTELRDRLAEVPNVVLLQPDAETYREVSVGGVTIAGFNDPRWFGDDDRDNAAKQVPAREAWQRAFEGRTAPDVAVSHEPAAVDGIAGRIRVNGHFHAAALEGNRIQVGTFTGGGTLSHYVARQTEDGSELVGQPAAFDILSFDASCDLASLSRYQFRNLTEGRPAYDSVQLVNGARVTEPLPTDGEDASARTCGPTAGAPAVEVTTTDVPAREPAE
ncbi:metallophosphoesterase family protein [Janibacter sp. G56]|uniref:metallophosphoesterase family protein n=1 Tax=Janibacter sp. G56 TaxID=3418717 RepID=UPI003D08C1D4